LGPIRCLGLMVTAKGAKPYVVQYWPKVLTHDD
jgi:hypothetical protein